jgi:hypothetical protein
MLIEVGLFADYHQERWRKGLAGLDSPRVRAGEGLVIRSDGLGYYAWLSSLLIDGDWCFDNEFDDHNPIGDYVPPATKRTERGCRPNPWSVGPACLWSLAIVPGHACLLALQRYELPWPADGYSLPYQLLVASVTLLASFLGLGLLHGICLRFTDPDRAALAAAFLTLGTTIIYYSAIEVSMAHGLGTVVAALLVWYWLRTYASADWRRWGLVGVLVGIAALMRWQLAAFALLPIGEAVCVAGGACSLSTCLLRLAIAGLGAVVAFSPQMMAWRVVYGHWLVAPFPVAHNWINPSWWKILATQDRSLFYWTPLAAIACLGYLHLPAKVRGQKSEVRSQNRLTSDHRPLTSDCLPALLLASAFLVQVYLLASLVGAQLYLGAAYGFRQLTESTVALAPGLALLLGRSSPWRFRVLSGIGGALVLWNLLLVCQYRYGYVPADAGADLATLLRNAVHLVARKRLLLLSPVALGPLLLALVWWKAPPSLEADML